MSPLDPSLTSARSFLRVVYDHLEAEPHNAPCAAHSAVHELTVHDARCTAEQIDELEHTARQLNTQLRGDLTALVGVLAASTGCATCAALADEAHHLHHDLRRRP